MWKALLMLLALGIIFVILLRLIERRSLRRQESARSPDPRDEEVAEEPAHDSVERRVRELVNELSATDLTTAREAANKLLTLGATAVPAMMPEFVRVERGRRKHDDAVIARRFEDTLTSMGPPALRPCLEAMAGDKGTFELFRGVRAVVAGMREGAARPVIESIHWLADEGLYVRGVLLLKSAGPQAVGALLRAVDSESGRRRKVVSELLIDLAQLYPAPLRERLEAAFPGDGRRLQGIVASPEVRRALLATLRELEVTEEDLPALGRAVVDPEAHVRREAWIALCGALGVPAIAAEAPLDSDDAAAAAQAYARDRGELPVLEGSRGPRLAVARIGVAARANGGATLSDLEGSLSEGPLEARLEAAAAIAHVGGGDAEDALLRVVHQAPQPLLETMIRGLGKTGSGKSVELLCELWEERGSHAARRAIVDLGSEAESRLIEYVSRRHPRMMEPAAMALGRRGATARVALAKLLAECHPEDPAVFAVEIAYELQGEDAVEDLIGMLPHERLPVLEVAAWALSQSRDPAACRPLLAQVHRLEDRYPVLSYIRNGPPEVHGIVEAFLEENPSHSDAAALRLAAGVDA